LSFSVPSAIFINLWNLLYNCALKSVFYATCEVKKIVGYCAIFLVQ
jgi:hypothetical protein